MSRYTPSYTSYRRPRRTRLYDSAYNIGYGLYRPTLDELERKYSVKLGRHSNLWAYRGDTYLPRYWGAGESTLARLSRAWRESSLPRTYRRYRETSVPRFWFNHETELDRFRRDLSVPRYRSPIHWSSRGVDHDLSLFDSRRRAARTITEDTILDRRHQRARSAFDSSRYSSGYANAAYAAATAAEATYEKDREFEQDLKSTMKRLKEADKRREKILSSDFSEDVDDYYDYNPRPLRARSLAREFSPAARAERESSVFNRRALKVVNDAEEAYNAPNLTRWSKLTKFDEEDSLPKYRISSFRRGVTVENDSSALAAQRAAQTKSRLRSLEEDIYEHEANLQAREKRLADYKNVLRESVDRDTYVDRFAQEFANLK